MVSPGPAEFHRRQKHRHRPMVGGDGGAGAGGVVAETGVEVVARKWVWEQRCGASHPVGAVCLRQVPGEAAVGPRMGRHVD